MPINQLGNPIAPQNNAVPTEVEEAQAAGNPEGARQIRSSRGSRAGRIVLGIFTLGISEGIRAIVHACRRAPDPEPRLAPQAAGVPPEVPVAQQAGLPPAEPSADVANRALAATLAQMPEDGPFKAAIEEALAPYAEVLGTDYAQTGLNGLPFSRELLMQVSSAVTASADRVTPEGLRAITEQIAPKLIGARLLEAMIRTYGARHNLTNSGAITAMKSSLMANSPEFSQALTQCRDLSSLRRIVENLRPRMEARVNLNERILQVRQDAVDEACRKFATQTGLEESVVRRALSFTRLEHKFNAIDVEILKGTHPLDAKVYQDLADQFVTDKIALFNSANAIGLTENVRVRLQELVLSQPNYKGAELIEKCAEAAQSLDCRSLLSALRDASGDKELVTALMESVAVQLLEAVQNAYGEEAWGRLDVDAQGIVREAASLVLIGTHPELQTAVANRPELCREVMEELNEREVQGIDAAFDGSMPELQARMLISTAGCAKVILQTAQKFAPGNQDLLQSLASGQLSPLCADTIEKSLSAFRRDFPNLLPEGNMESVLKFRSPAGDSIGALLRRDITAADHPLSLSEVGELFRKQLHVTANFSLVTESLGSIAEANHWQFSDAELLAAARQLFKRQPQLHDLLNRTSTLAEAKQTCTAYFGQNAVCREILRVRHDLASVWSAGKERLYERMSEITGKPIETLREKLNLGKINESGKFAYFRKDCFDALENPATDHFLTTEAISQKINGFIDDFLTEKTALLESVDVFVQDFGLDPTLAAVWKENVLTTATLARRDFLVNCISIADQMPAAPLETAFGSENKLRKMSDEKLLELFYAIADVQIELPQRVFVGEELGSDEKGLIRRYTREAFLSKHPELSIVRSRPELLRRLSNLAENRAYELQRSISELPEEEALRAGNEMTKYVLVVELIDAMLPASDT